eukprot:2683116-Pyramimonas_sp.AAC.2
MALRVGGKDLFVQTSDGFRRRRLTQVTKQCTARSLPCNRYHPSVLVQIFLGICHGRGAVSTAAAVALAAPAHPGYPLPERSTPQNHDRRFNWNQARFNGLCEAPCLKPAWLCTRLL